MAKEGRPEAASPDDAEFDEADAAPAKKTASNVGSIETEKVTDFAIEKETKVDEVTLQQTLTMLNKVAMSERAAQEKRMLARDAIKLNREDVNILRDEMDATEEEAESALKDHNGDLVAALRAITV